MGTEVANGDGSSNCGNVAGGDGGSKAIYEKLMSYAFFVLGVRRLTSHEMREKLKRRCKEKFGSQRFAEQSAKKIVSPEAQTAIECVINRLTELKYLNDEEYLADFVRNRLALKPRGIGALKYELRKKGISQAAIEKYFSENEIDEMEVAGRITESKLARMKRVPEQKKFSKIAMLLNSRGFKPHTIYEILNNLKNGKTTND